MPGQVVLLRGNILRNLVDFLIHRRPGPHLNRHQQSSLQTLQSKIPVEHSSQPGGNGRVTKRRRTHHRYPHRDDHPTGGIDVAGGEGGPASWSTSNTGRLGPLGVGGRDRFSGECPAQPDCTTAWPTRPWNNSRSRIITWTRRLARKG